jgi:hypothetical protein
MNMWPDLWPGLAWPQAIMAPGRCRGLRFLTHGLKSGRPQAAASGRFRPWPGPWPAVADRHWNLLKKARSRSRAARMGAELPVELGMRAGPVLIIMFTSWYRL